MELFLFSFVVFALAVVGMALGVIFRRSPIKGSCGGSGCGACRGSCHRDGEETGQAA